MPLNKACIVFTYNNVIQLVMKRSAFM